MLNESFRDLFRSARPPIRAARVTLTEPTQQIRSTSQPYVDACVAALRYAESRRYRGYSKHDGLNSPLLHALALNNKWLRLLLIQLVMRAPVNIKPLLGVRRTIDPKGMSLFVRAYLVLHEIGVEPQDATPCLTHARACLDWLAANSSRTRGYAGHCWGYPYDWQDAGFFAPAGMPNCVVTCFVARAFVHAFEVTGERGYLDIARSTCDFLLKDLTVLHDAPDMLCLSYAPVAMRWIVMDTSALAGALLAVVARHTKETELQRQARRLVTYVVDKQTDYGAWYYSHPPTDSHITHDNYHTGFILDAILDYTDATGDRSLMINYERGLAFYAERLFLSDGAPKWMHDVALPHDVHGAAQGIITFSKPAARAAGHAPLAARIADWTLANLYDPGEGRFYYQQGRFWTKRFTLMRWGNAWMAWALAQLIRSGGGHHE